MSFAQLFQAIEDSAIGEAIRSNELLFPLLESLHVIAIATVVGSIAFVDLRLLGFGATRKPASAVMEEVLPITRWSFVGAILTGLLLFSSHAATYTHNAAFLLKMGLLVVALINVAVFHRIIARDIASWDTAAQTPPMAKLAGGASLVLWITIVASGRWIGFL